VTVTLTPEGESRYRLAGDLTFATVPALYEDADLDFTATQIRVDLADVRHADSAGLALLLEWLRIARVAECDIVYLHIPAQLQSLIEVSGLEDLVRLED
jgi:phospholipid transport system transporter-binding protein